VATTPPQPPQQPPYAGWAPAAPPPGVPRLSSWGRRLAAYLIDSLLLYFAAGVVSTPFFVAGGTANPDNGVLIGFGVVFVFLVLLVGQPLYFTISHGSQRGQTLAKRWLGIRVVDDKTGAPIGYGRAFGRWLVVFALGLFCGLLNILDGLWPLWDPLKQSWHDKVANSVVIRLPS
jgi:uncharacterized RDD family membrane protein YckC